jgi:hypothetical protein
VFPSFLLPLLLLLLLLQVLACIGEQFDEGDEVCGVTVNIRNGKDRLELWSKTAANEALQMSIGKQLKQMLDISDSNKIGFVVFVSIIQLCCLVWAVSNGHAAVISAQGFQDCHAPLGTCACCPELSDHVALLCLSLPASCC